MKPLGLGELAAIVDGELSGDSAITITGFALDSREVKSGDLFLAVRGANVDGHDFAESALSAEAAASLGERPLPGPHVVVPNLIQALAKIGRHFRSAFNHPVVGITGSVGKTTTKEFMAAALSPLGPVLKTEGNRNTEYTSPLLWTEVTPDHRAAVVEMGMRGFGQIAYLASIARPSVGVVTNVGHSHLDLVGDRDGIARAKAELLESLPEGGLSVLWAEDDYLDFLTKAAKGPAKTFGFSEAADSQITFYRAESWRTSRVSGVTNGEEWSATLPGAGRHLAINAAACVLVASELGVAPREAASRLEGASLPPMRMEIHEHLGATLVLDAYNASPESMVAAIETLAELPSAGRRLAVIGGMKELGSYSSEGHRVVGAALAKHRIDAAIFYGEFTDESFRAAKGVDGRMAETLEDVTRFLAELRPGDTVLIKGSRAMELEKSLEPLLGAAR